MDERTIAHTDCETGEIVERPLTPDELAQNAADAAAARTEPVAPAAAALEQLATLPADAPVPAGLIQDILGMRGDTP